MTPLEALDAGTGKCYDDIETTLTLLRLVLVGVNLKNVE
jgi:hypothetical protein